MLGIINNLSTRLNSHNAGFTLVSRSVLESKFKEKIEILDNRCDYNNYDVIIINEGVNYKEGIFNFFGGVQQRQIDSLIKISNYKGILYSVNYEVNYNNLIKKRKELNNIDISFKIPSVIDLSKVNNKLILGDSHSLSIYKPGYSISRNDGKTLYGFLKLGLNSFIDQNTNELIFYAGNIDIRFHIHEKGGKEIIKSLCLDLYEQVSFLKLKGIKVTLTHLIPIEDEDRKIPGTGKYKGYNFLGTKKERMDYVVYFNSLIDRIAFSLELNIIRWDFNYEEGLLFSNMESKQSVHIRPEYYKYINELL